MSSIIFYKNAGLQPLSTDVLQTPEYYFLTNSIYILSITLNCCFFHLCCINSDSEVGLHAPFTKHLFSGFVFASLWAERLAVAGEVEQVTL